MTTSEWLLTDKYGRNKYVNKRYQCDILTEFTATSTMDIGFNAKNIQRRTPGNVIHLTLI